MIYVYQYLFVNFLIHMVLLLMVYERMKVNHIRVGLSFVLKQRSTIFTYLLANALMVRSPVWEIHVRTAQRMSSGVTMDAALSKPLNAMEDGSALMAVMNMTVKVRIK